MKTPRIVIRVGAGCALALSALLTFPFSPTSAASFGNRQQGEPRLSSWKRLSAGDIEAVGDVADGALRRAWAEISTFRSAFVELYPAWRVSSPVPTRVIVFPDAAAFRRFSPRDDRGRPNENVGGYFSAGPDANSLTIGADQPASCSTGLRTTC